MTMDNIPSDYVDAVATMTSAPQSLGALMTPSEQIAFLNGTGGPPFTAAGRAAVLYGEPLATMTMPAEEAYMQRHVEQHAVAKTAATSPLIARIRAVQMAAAEAMDHAVRAEVGDVLQHKNRIEVCSSAIANAARACAEAAYELAREVGKR